VLFSLGTPTLRDCDPGNTYCTWLWTWQHLLYVIVNLATPTVRDCEPGNTYRTWLWTWQHLVYVILNLATPSVRDFEPGNTSAVRGSEPVPSITFSVLQLLAFHTKKVRRLDEMRMCRSIEVQERQDKDGFIDAYAWVRRNNLRHVASGVSDRAVMSGAKAGVDACKQVTRVTMTVTSAYGRGSCVWRTNWETDIPL
jgi:hypothetical protein